MVFLEAPNIATSEGREDSSSTPFDPLELTNGLTLLLLGAFPLKAALIEESTNRPLLVIFLFLDGPAVAFAEGNSSTPALALFILTGGVSPKPCKRVFAFDVGRSSFPIPPDILSNNDGLVPEADPEEIRDKSEVLTDWWRSCFHAPASGFPFL